MYREGLFLRADLNGNDTTEAVAILESVVWYGSGITTRTWEVS